MPDTTSGGDASGFDVVAILTPIPSAYTESSRLVLDGSNAVLTCVYEHRGAMYSGGFSFSQVRAIRFLAEAHTEIWHLAAAGSGVLVHVHDSAWIHDLRSAQPGYSDRWLPRHYLIYVESEGAYEIAATSFETLPVIALPQGAA